MVRGGPKNSLAVSKDTMIVNQLLTVASTLVRSFVILEMPKSNTVLDLLMWSATALVVKLLCKRWSLLDPVVWMIYPIARRSVENPWLVDINVRRSVILETAHHVWRGWKSPVAVEGRLLRLYVTRA